MYRREKLLDYCFGEVNSNYLYSMVLIYLIHNMMFYDLAGR